MKDSDIIARHEVIINDLRLILPEGVKFYNTGVDNRFGSWRRGHWIQLINEKSKRFVMKVIPGLMPDDRKVNKSIEELIAIAIN